MKFFTISQEAQEALRKTLRFADAKKPVFAVVRGTTPGTSEIKWGVGIYEKEHLGDTVDIEAVEGFEFYFDASLRAELAGKTLDFENGKFKLV